MAEENQEQAPKKKLPVKALAVVALVMLFEAGAIATAFILAGQPEDVRAQAAAATEAAKADEPVEVLVVEGKFQNTRTGRTYLYDTQIYAVVSAKHQAKVQAELERMEAAVTMDVATVFRRAEPSHLLEPTLATLIRQIHSALNDRLGANEEGEPIVREVIVGRYTQIRADY